MDEQHERSLRRKALRLTLRGVPPRLILRQIPRRRTWLHKWQRRFRRLGWAGLRSQSRRPRRSALSRQQCASVRRPRRILQVPGAFPR